jgi:hypothetical protein
LARAYHYVRWRWWTKIDLEEVSEELSQSYVVESLNRPSYELELTFRKDEREEILVRSDTLKVYVSAFRAVMFQKEPAPFTPKDMELRNRVIELYPHERPTPLPMQFSTEPQFETIEQTE